MGGELTRAAKDFDAHLHLNLRRFRAAMPTPRSSAMAHQTLPQSDRLPASRDPPARLYFWKRCVRFCTGTRMSTEDLVGKALHSNHQRKTT